MPTLLLAALLLAAPAGAASPTVDAAPPAAPPVTVLTDPTSMVPVDSTAPTLRLTLGYPRGVSRDGVLTLSASCSERCALRVETRIAIGGSVLASPRRADSTATVRPGESAIVLVKLSRRERAAVCRALRRGSPIVARVLATARDAGGNLEQTRHALELGPLAGPAR